MGIRGCGEIFVFVKVGDKDSLVWVGGRVGGRRYTDVRFFRRSFIIGFRVYFRFSKRLFR